MAQAVRRRHAAGRHPGRRRALRAGPQPVARLADDHAPRARLAGALGVDPSTRGQQHRRAQRARRAEVAGKARAAGVLVSALGPQLLRLVTHLDVDDDGIERAVEVLVPLVR